MVTARKSKKAIRELSRMTLKPNCRFCSGSVHPLEILGGPRPVDQPEP
jgi:hypothetical protein